MQHLALCQSLTLSSTQSSIPPTPKSCAQHISLTALMWIKPNCSLHNTNNIPFCPEDTSQQMQTKPQQTNQPAIKCKNTVRLSLPSHNNNIWLCWHKCNFCRPTSRQELNAVVCYSLTQSLVCLWEFIYCCQQSL